MTISPASPNALGATVYQIGGAAAPLSGSWGSANLMIAYPWLLARPVRVEKFYWVNGSAAGGNWDMCVYDADYNQVGSAAGSTGGSGNSVPQAVAPASGAFTIGPGVFYIACVHDSNTANRAFRWAAGQSYYPRIVGMWQQASVTTGSMPSPATPAVSAAINIPLCGVICRTVFDV